MKVAAPVLVLVLVALALALAQQRRHTDLPSWLLQTRWLCIGLESWEGKLHIDRHRAVDFANQLGFLHNPTVLMPSRP